MEIWAATSVWKFISTLKIPILFKSFFKTICEGFISTLNFSEIAVEISFGLIEPYNSPFSLLSLLKTKDLLLIILAPLLGLISDRYGDKKKFLLFFASVSITSTLLLVVVDRDSWAIASILFSISVLGFMLSNVFYDSMIMNFNEKKFRNTISSYGYAFGYLGGGIAFIIAILVVLFSGSNIEIIHNIE